MAINTGNIAKLLWPGVNAVWGKEYVDESDYLRVYVRRLRRKLEDDPEHPKLIVTERGFGYRFVAD